MADHTREELEARDNEALLDVAIDELDESEYDGTFEPDELTEQDRARIIAALTESDEDKAEREAKQAELSGQANVASVDLSNVNLEEQSVPDLKAYAKQAGIAGYSNMRKDELLAALSSSVQVQTVPDAGDQYPLRQSQRRMDDPDSGDDPAWGAGLSSLHRREGKGGQVENLLGK